MHSVWPIPKIDYLPFSDVHETRPVALVYSNPAWDAVKSRLKLPVVWQTEAREASEAVWMPLADQVQGEVIYAVGGGLTVDTAKYLAARRKLPLVCLPTALSVDAFLTWASGVRRDGCVYYIETRPPDHLVVDLEVLAAAPASLRAAGICDVLSIATGSWDWHFAQEKGQNPAAMRYVAYADQVVQGILRGALDCAEAAGRGDADGLKQLLDCLALEVQLCNQLGHSRPEEGSEHYFAYSAENLIGKGLPHGDLVGPGIVLMAALQRQDVMLLKRALTVCNVVMTSIPTDVIKATLRALPDYSRRHNLPYGIAHELREAEWERLPSLF